MHQCVKFILFGVTLYMFGRSFSPSSGVQDCTYSNRHMSNRYCRLLASRNEMEHSSISFETRADCLLVGTRWNLLHLVAFTLEYITMHGPMNVKSKDALYLTFMDKRFKGSCNGARMM